MNVVQRVVKNFFSLAAAEVLMRIIAFAAVVYIARALGATVFGKLAFALAFVSYFTILSNIGLTTLGIREIARWKDRAAEYAGNIVALRFFFSLASFFLLIGATYFLAIPINTKAIVMIYGLTMLMESLNISWIFQAFERMEFDALIKILNRLIYVVLVISLVGIFMNYYMIPLALIIAESIAFILAALIAYKFAKIKLRFDLKLWKELFFEAIPIGISMVMISIYINFDTVMLSFMKGEEVTGWYNAGYKIIFFIVSIGGVYMAAIYPILSYRFNSSIESLARVVEKSAKLMAAIAFPLVIGGVLVAHKLIGSVFGREFLPAVPSFQVLLIGAGVIFLSMAYGNSLIACNRQKQYTIAVTIGAVVNLILNFILIPKYSLFGAAVATLIAEILVFLKNYTEFQKITKVSILPYIPVPLTASAIMALILFPIRNLGIHITIPLGGVIYIALFLLFRGLSKEDMEVLSQVFKRPFKAVDIGEV
ncbi:MAG: flippase [Candidatus Saganbacteria bacterium]|nr:flippase [Candidatus Saganbacteria bacterium]